MGTAAPFPRPTSPETSSTAASSTPPDMLRCGGSLPGPGGGPAAPSVAVAAGPGHAEACDEDPREAFTPPGLTPWEWFKIVFFTVTLIAPLRLVLITLLFLALYPLAMCGPRWYERLSKFVFRAILFAGGFHVIWRRRIATDQHGRPLDAADLATSDHRHPPVIVTNHVSLWDSLWILTSTSVSILAKREVFAIPGISKVLRASRSVPVERDSAAGRKAAVDAILNRREDEPPLLIYPQGTTSLPTFMTPFKRGAFLKGAVRPYVIDMDHYLTLGIEHGMFFCFYWSLCCFYNSSTLTQLPDFYMDTERGEGVDAFRERVREAMCAALPGCRLSTATVGRAMALRKELGPYARSSVSGASGAGGASALAASTASSPARLSSTPAALEV